MSLKKRIHTGIRAIPNNFRLEKVQLRTVAPFIVNVDFFLALG